MGFARRYIKKYFPLPWKVASYLKHRERLSGPIENRFTSIYKKNIWGDTESVSGPGSNMEQTETLRRELPEFLKRFHIRTMLDIPCGDFNWMKETSVDLDQYIGGDIVAELIAENTSRYADEKHRFSKLDVTTDSLPTVDVILCRDCLVHLSYDDIRNAFANIQKSGSKYLLATTFTDRQENKDITTGEWRPTNLQQPPFSLPEPLAILNEQCPEEPYRDKSLGLWKVEELPTV